MSAADTSVIVAGLSSWHDRHESCRSALDDGPDVVGHALVEAFSVLTRLPAPFRVPADLAAELLAEQFRGTPLMMGPLELVPFLGGLAVAGIRGGSVYDALIGATARSAGATLLTLDVRAQRTYEAVGAEVLLL